MSADGSLKLAPAPKPAGLGFARRHARERNTDRPPSVHESAAGSVGSPWRRSEHVLCGGACSWSLPGRVHLASVGESWQRRAALPWRCGWQALLLRLHPALAACTRPGAAASRL